MARMLPLSNQCRNPARRTPLMISCKLNDIAAVRCQIKMGGSIEHRDNRGRTALYRAAKAGNVEITQELVDAGADITAQTNVNRESPLFIACLCNNVECARLLLREQKRQCAANPSLLEAFCNMRSVDGWDPVMAAAVIGCVVSGGVSVARVHAMLT